MKAGLFLLALGVVLFLLAVSGTITGPPGDTVYMVGIVSFIAGIIAIVIGQFRGRR
jgi:hypothetical protein